MLNTTNIEVIVSKSEGFNPERGHIPCREVGKRGRVEVMARCRRFEQAFVILHCSYLQGFMNLYRPFRQVFVDLYRPFRQVFVDLYRPFRQIFADFYRPFRQVKQKKYYLCGLKI